jgi:hypothetical protein
MAQEQKGTTRQPEWWEAAVGILSHWRNLSFAFGASRPAPRDLVDHLT